MQFLSDRDVKVFGGTEQLLSCHSAVIAWVLGQVFAWALEQALFGRQAAWRLGRLMIAGLCHQASWWQV